MEDSGWAARLLSELAAARAAVATSYQRLWPTAERARRVPDAADAPRPRDDTNPQGRHDPASRGRPRSW